MMQIAKLCVPAAVLISFGLGSVAAAQTVMVDLTGGAENPPVTTDGNGTATVTWDSNTYEVFITGSYQNMSSPVTAAHLHGLADADNNAGILFGLTTDGGTSGTLSGSGTLSVNDFFNGFLEDLTYINVHTNDHPAGEIRGQVVIPEPTTATAALAAMGLLLRRRRRA